MENLRPELQTFATEMEAVLKANDHKGGWSNLDPCWLFMRLQEEVQELGHQLTRLRGRDPETISREAADVANFAMMISDVCTKGQ